MQTLPCCHCCSRVLLHCFCRNTQSSETPETSNWVQNTFNLGGSRAAGNTDVSPDLTLLWRQSPQETKELSTD